MPPPLPPPPPPTESVYPLNPKLRPPRHTLVTASTDNTLKLWDLRPILGLEGAAAAATATPGMMSPGWPAQLRRPPQRPGAPCAIVPER